MKKKLYLFIFFISIVSLGLNETLAQVPQSFLYQAEARDSHGKILSEEQLSVRVNILQDESEVYQETHNVMTDLNGLFNLRIGEGDIVDGQFSSIDWSSGPYFLNIGIAIGASENYTDMGTTQLLSVPYALHAETVSNIDGFSVDDADADPSNEIQTIGAVLNEGNDGGEHQIKNIADPTDAQDVVTKKYIVDLLIKTGHTIQQLLDAGASVSDLFNAGVGVGLLRDNGVTEQELEDAGLTGTFTDSRDGHEYSWVKIGEQVWMAENLAFDAASGSYAYNNDENNVGTYGRLYTWDAAGTACPDGWHLPSDAEWTILRDYLGGESVAGGKMKEKGTVHWYDPNNGATNSSGFSGLPGGYRSYNGTFHLIGSYGFWWSATELNSTHAWHRGLYYNLASILRYDTDKENGFSVRCVRDE